MSAQPTTAIKVPALTDQEVAAYLESQPEFLVRNPDILKSQEAPGRWSGADGVVDMQKVMTDRLRDEVQNLTECAQDMIHTSRDNMTYQTRTHAAVMALLGAGNVENACRILTEDFPLLLDVDAVVLGFEESPTLDPASPLYSIPYVRLLPEGFIDAFVGDAQETRLTADYDDEAGLFGATPHQARSVAAVRLRPGLTTPDGLIVLGSRSPQTFQPGQGTDLLSFLTRVSERVLHLWLEKI